MDKLAEKHKWDFKTVSSLESFLAVGNLGEKKVLLLKPKTYMNSSGQAVEKALSYYKVPLAQMIVVSDDIYLPFAEFRMRLRGGSGGHNGLKSIESHLGTQDYARLKVGIGDRQGGDLSDHVLSPFRSEENEKLPCILQKAADVLELWLLQGIDAAMLSANSCQETKKPEQPLGE